jgi:hypothetical protein
MFCAGVSRGAVFPLCSSILPRDGRIAAGHDFEPGSPVVSLTALPVILRIIIRKSALDT